MEIENKKEILERLVSLRMSAISLEIFLNQSGDKITEDDYYTGLVELDAEALQLRRLIKQQKDGLPGAQQREDEMREKALIAGVEALELEAQKCQDRGDNEGAEKCRKSALLIREQIRTSDINERRSRIKIVE